MSDGPLSLGRGVVMPLAVLGTAATLVFGVGRATERASQVERRAEEVAAHLTEHAREDAARWQEAHAKIEAGTTRITALEVGYAHISQSLGRIEGKLDGIERSMPPKGVAQR